MKKITNPIVVLLITLNGFRFGQWIQTNGPYGGIKCFAMSGSNLFAGTSGGVFLSTNSGTNWNAVNTGLTNTDVNALTILDIYIIMLFSGFDEHLC